MLCSGIRGPGMVQLGSTWGSIWESIWDRSGARDPLGVDLGSICGVDHVFLPRIAAVRVCYFRKTHASRAWFKMP